MSHYSSKMENKLNKIMITTLMAVGLNVYGQENQVYPKGPYGAVYYLSDAEGKTYGCYHKIEPVGNGYWAELGNCQYLISREGETLISDDLLCDKIQKTLIQHKQESLKRK